MVPVTLSANNTGKHLLSEGHEQLYALYESLLSPVGNGSSRLISLIPLTPVGLCAQWHCGPEALRHLLFLCERPTGKVREDEEMLLNLAHQLYDAELELATSLARKYSDRTLARNSFSPVRNTKITNPVGFNYSVLLRCLIDRFAALRYPFGVHYPARVPCHNELPLGKHMGHFVRQLETWPRVMKSFYISYRAVPAVRTTDDRSSVMESLVSGIIEAGQSARMATVESNFCSAALGLLAMLTKGDDKAQVKDMDLGKVILANSNGDVAEVVRDMLRVVPNNNLLRALHLAVVVSPVCLFGEYVTGHTTSKRVTQSGLVDYLVRNTVERDANLIVVERFGLQLILDMVMNGRDYFHRKLPLLMEQLEKMGVEDPQFEGNTQVSHTYSDWNTVKSTVVDGGHVKWKCCRLLHCIAEFKGRSVDCPVNIREEDWLSNALLAYDQIMEQFRLLDAPPVPTRALAVAAATPSSALTTRDAIIEQFRLLAVPPVLTRDPSVAAATPSSGVTTRDGTDAPVAPRTAELCTPPPAKHSPALTTNPSDTTVVNSSTASPFGTPPVQKHPTRCPSPPSLLGSPIVLKRRVGLDSTRPVPKRPRIAEFPLVQGSMDEDVSRIALSAYAYKLSGTIGVLQAPSPTYWNDATLHIRGWRGLESEQTFLGEANSNQLHPNEHTTVAQFYRFAWRTLTDADHRRAFASTCVHVVGKSSSGNDALGRCVTSSDLPACRITSWEAVEAIRTMVDTTANRLVRDLTSADAASRTFRMTIEDFISNVNNRAPQAIVFEEHLLNVDYLMPFLESLDDSSPYLGNELEWATDLERLSMMPRWMNVTGGGIISRARIASSGLCTMVSVVLGSMLVYLAHGEPSLTVDGWSVEKWETVYMRQGERLYIKPNTVYFTVSIRDTLILGARFYCADTLSSTLSAVVREHFFGIGIVDGHVYEESILSLFSLLRRWVFLSPGRLPAWSEVASLFVLVLHLDQLAPTSVDDRTVWQETDAFRADFKRAQQLLDQLWVDVNCPELYDELQKVEAELEEACVMYLDQRGLLSLAVQMKPVADRFPLLF